MDNHDTYRLGVFLRAAREQRGLTQEDLAERVAGRISVKTISNVERGRHRPQRHIVLQFIEALGLTEAERAACLEAWRWMGTYRGADRSARPGSEQKGHVPPSPHPYACSFCGTPRAQVQRLIAGPNGVFICDQCVARCNEILTKEEARA
jgi:transcriptional regulator with XRE-family HTH domain